MTEQEIGAWALRDMLRRMSDKDYDDKQFVLFKGKTADEAAEIIRKEILNGRL